MEKYGFIYIWFDRKHKRYYIGSHWGTEDDGYVCSSTWARNSINRRPSDFKRRILKRIYTTRKDLYEEETRWLQMIKPEEVKVKYYNFHRVANHWIASEKDRLTISEKISIANKNNMKDPENRKKISEATKEAMANREVRNRLSKSLTEYFSKDENRKIVSARLKKHYEDPENRKKRSESARKAMEDPTKRKNMARIGKRHGMYGKKHNDSTIEKMKINNAMHKEENRQKIRDAKAGIRVLTNGINRKMAIRNTDKWNMLIADNYVPVGIRT